MIKVTEKEWVYRGFKCKVDFVETYRCGYVYIPKDTTCAKLISDYSVCSSKTGVLTLGEEGHNLVYSFNYGRPNDSCDFETAYRYAKTEEDKAILKHIQGLVEPFQREINIRTLGYCVAACEDIVDQIINICLLRGDK